MNDKEFRAMALAHSGATESSHMNHPDFRYAGKIFATLGAPSGEWGMVKLTPDQQKSFLDADSKSFQPASGSWGRQGCTMVQLATAKKSLVKSALKLAIDNLEQSSAPVRPKPAKRAKKSREGP